MLYELHLTVNPSTDIQRWSEWCEEYGAKPLRIELESNNPNNPVQIMFAAVTEGDDAWASQWCTEYFTMAENDGFDVIRSKLEVPLDKAGGYQAWAYHECHVKSLIPGPVVKQVVDTAAEAGWVASRNGLFTHDNGLEKWYFTKRAYDENYLTAGRIFRDAFSELPQHGFNAVRMESETVLMDSFEELDAGWIV